MLREMPNWKWLLIRFTISASIYGAIAWVAFGIGKGFGLLALVFFSPLIGVAVARPLVELTHEGFSWLWHTSMQEWQGRYYRFNDVQVRVYEHDGELWFAARDVMLAAAMSPIPDAVLEERAGECGLIGDTGLIGWSVAGVERFFAEHPGTGAGKLLLWIRREVVAPWQNKKGTR